MEFNFTTPKSPRILSQSARLLPAFSEAPRNRIAVTGGFYGPWLAFSLTDPSLIAHYRLEGNGLDGAGTNHGTTNQTTTVAGAFGQALNFVGSSGSYVRVTSPSGLPLGTGPRTYMGWTKPGSVFSSFPMTLLDHGPSTASNGTRVTVAMASQRLRLDLGGTFLTQNLNPGKTFAINQWNHWAVTYDGTTWRTYLGGELVGQGAVLEINTKNGPFFLGRPNPTVNTTNTLTGAMDEVEIYDRSLSASEIQAAAAELQTGGGGEK